MERPTERDWACSKPGCGLDVDGHDFALALEHAFHDEPGFNAQDARDVADRTLSRVARAFGVEEDLADPDHCTDPRGHDDRPGTYHMHGRPDQRYHQCTRCGRRRPR